MKTHKYHIIFSRILLFCFMAGQYMMYAHQHKLSVSTVKFDGISKNTSGPTVTEKCYLCDVMHHNAMVKTAQVFFNPAAAEGHVYKSTSYNFTSIQLILSGGRAPPVPGYRS